MSRPVGRLIFLPLILGVCQLSCSPNPGDPNYIDWVEDYNNGMHVRHVQKDLIFDLQFQPAEFVWMQRNGLFDQDAFNAERADFEQIRYFILNISSLDGKKNVIDQRANGDVQRSGELLYYFSYRFQNDISLFDSNNQEIVVLFHFEQHGTKSFVLAFQKKDNAANNVIVSIHSPVIDNMPVNIKISTDPQVL